MLLLLRGLDMRVTSMWVLFNYFSDFVAVSIV